MKQKLVQRQAQQQEVTPVEKSTEREFENAEELLRHDALHTPVPPRIAQRLQESLDKTPALPQPWWRRFMP
jgi:hypothetical protein